MNANSMCISCFIEKQEKKIRPFPDEAQKSQYMHLVLELLYQYGQTESAPQIAERIDRLYQNFWGQAEDYTLIKRRYNQLLLNIENNIRNRIEQSEDVIKECIKYVCAANYIDFGAVDNVNESTFELLLEKAAGENISPEEYRAFRSDLEEARTLVYLTDNCGEIVLDKLFIQFLKEMYPNLRITAIVRGENTINDATLEDAREVGLTDIVPCIGNGTAIPGTVISKISPQAREALLTADMILSKGQGNFESLFGEGLNPYYLFLCKCELFVHRFGLKLYSSVFGREERICLTQAHHITDLK
ncbi:MAG: DUF89 family protein [Lachnospiraceae bacterium]|nr:DUF89 family protein [Lachnospiraceae bacterium]